MTKTKTAPIKGVPTETQKAKARATAKGPKQGSAQANQSVKYDADTKAIIKTNGGIAPARKTNAKNNGDRIVQALATVFDGPVKSKNPDKVTSVKPTTSGTDAVVVSAGADKTVIIPRGRFVGELTKLAIVGGSLRAVQEYIATHKQPAKLAHGITGRDAPHSAMAAADSNKPAPKAPTTAKAAPKGKTASRNPKGAFSYVIGKPADRKAGTWTQHMLLMMQSATNTDDAAAKHAKSGAYGDKKLHFSWARDNGYIKY